MSGRQARLESAFRDCVRSCCHSACDVRQRQMTACAEKTDSSWHGMKGRRRCNAVLAPNGRMYATCRCGAAPRSSSGRWAGQLAKHSCRCPQRVDGCRSRRGEAVAQGRVRGMPIASSTPTSGFGHPVVPTKTNEQFERLPARFPGRRVVIVGDQPDRDIIPAKAAGCVTVFVPSRCTRSWNKKAEQGSTDFVATDLLQAISWCIRTTENR